jgi:hypothetical protein
VHYLLDLTFIRPDGIPAIVLSFYCKYQSGDVALDEDATEFAWVKASDVSGYDLISGIDHEIEMVEDILSNNGNTLHP